jgi:hypothetical protein
MGQEKGVGQKKQNITSSLAVWNHVLCDCFQ